MLWSSSLLSLLFRAVRRNRSVVFAVAAATMAACGGGGTAAPAKVATVELTPASVTKIVGETVQLTATARDASGNALSGRTVAWLSGNTAIATVSATGLVTCLTTGTVSISAAIEGQSASISITVSPPPVATVVLSPSTLSILTGRTGQLNVEARSAGGAVLTGRVATWSSATVAVATVSAAGVVTGVTPGTSVITVNIEGKTATATVTVTLNPCSLAAAHTLTFGTPYNGNLAATACPFLDNGVPDGTYFDLILFDIATMGTYQIDMVTTAFDAYLFFYQFNGSDFLYQSQDDNGGGGTNARITSVMIPGTYLVFANSLNANGFGAYTLSVKVAGSAVVAAGPVTTPVNAPIVRRLGRFNSAQVAQIVQSLKRSPR